MAGKLGSAPLCLKCIAMNQLNKIILYSVPFICSFLFKPERLNSQQLTLVPEKPHPGDTLKITYNASGGLLQDMDTVHCVAIIYQGLFSDSKKVTLKKQGSVYQGQLITDSGFCMVAFGFGSGKTWDKNPEGYIYPFYNGDIPVRMSMYSMGDLYLSSTLKTLYGLEKNHEKALTYFKKEWDLYPHSDAVTRVIQAYYGSLYEINRDIALKEVDSLISDIRKADIKTDKEYLFIYRLLMAIHKTEQANAVLDELSKKFPKSDIIFVKRYKDVLGAASAIEMEAMAHQLILDYDMLHRPTFSSSLPSVYSAVSIAYISEGNIPMFYSSAKKHEKDTSYLIHDFKEAARILSEEGNNLDDAEKMIRYSLDLLSSFSSTENNRKRKAEALVILGNILYQKGDNSTALELLGKVYDTNPADVNDLTPYALALVKGKHYEKAIPLLEELLKKGSRSEKIRSAFQESYFATGGDRKKYDALLQIFRDTTMHKIKQSMLEEPAPYFTLRDLNGKKVSIKDYQGKIVVIDFWATWCIPCKQAFPGMQQLIDKYAGRKDVVFLFINTLETFTGNLKTEIRSYLKKNKFGFKVLLDDMSTTAQGYNTALSYKITALPSKLVIDKTGLIRFRSIGYPGSSEKVVEELSWLIDIVSEL